MGVLPSCSSWLQGLLIPWKAVVMTQVPGCLPPMSSQLPASAQASLSHDSIGGGGYTDGNTFPLTLSVSQINKSSHWILFNEQSNNLFFFLIWTFIYFKKDRKKKRDTKKSPNCFSAFWLRTSVKEISHLVRNSPNGCNGWNRESQSQGQEFHLGLPHGWQRPKH